MAILLLLAFIFFTVIWIRKTQYEKTPYYIQTKNSWWKVHSDKGLAGKFAAFQCLRTLKGYKRFLFNLYVPKENGETTEADLVLLHESGIYVLESKNYSGWIFGTETQTYWTQTLRSGRGKAKKEQFYNPILQNKGHLKWLQSFLADQTLPFYSCIVFSDHCTLKNITLTSGKHCVVNQSGLLHAVRQNIGKTGPALSPARIDALYTKLYPLTQADAAQKALHIKNIEQKKQSITSCPRCGGKLILRTASTGSRQGKRFIGCSNYPGCRYIQNLADSEDLHRLPSASQETSFRETRSDNVMPSK